jgi:phage gpG-like protein
MNEAQQFLKYVDVLTKALDRLPQKIAEEAKNFSKERFVKQNWIDGSGGQERWAKRAKARGGKQRSAGAVLVDSSRLKKSIRIVSVTPAEVVIGSDVPYAKIHNEGAVNLTESVKAHNRESRKGKVHQVKAFTRKMNMPKRQFLGPSRALDIRLERMITREFTQALESAIN